MSIFDFILCTICIGGLIIAIFLGGMGAGENYQRDRTTQEIHAELVKMGLAYYTADPKTGLVVFNYATNKVEKQ